MRIGPGKELNKNYSLGEHFESLFYGDRVYFSDNFFEFVDSQYDRFSIPRAPERFVEEIANLVWMCIFYYDPYWWFSGWMGVENNENWRTHTYEIIDIDGNKFEVDPEDCDTFSLTLWDNEEVFRNVMSHPSIESLPESIGHLLKDAYNGELFGEHFWDTLSEDLKNEMRVLATTETGFHNENIQAYIELTIWATVAWFVSPYAHDFRTSYILIFSVCMEFGECILYHGNVYSPEEYKVYKRPPRSCMVCGIDAWCVEQVYIDGVIRYMCEHHVDSHSEGLRCGSRICRYVECPNHALYGQGLSSTDLMRYNTRKLLNGFKQDMVEWSSHR